MSAKSQNLGNNLVQSDVHIIQPNEYEDLPELTDTDLARAAWHMAGNVVSAEAGKAAFSAALKKQKINLTLDPDVLAFFKQQAGGRGYQTLINATLREAMRARSMEDILRKVIREELHIR
ncbi:MAG: BrnA antitoxin family protein [Sulfuriferula sp.]